MKKVNVLNGAELKNQSIMLNVLKGILYISIIFSCLIEVVM